jgi:hypothetical protein
MTFIEKITIHLLEKLNEKVDRKKIEDKALL